MSRSEHLRLMEYFVAGTPARTAADLVGVHRNSAIRFFHKLREREREREDCSQIAKS